MKLRVGIIGLGRVGRSALRNNFANIAEGRFEVCVLSDVMPITQVAYLLENDSTYGKPAFTVDCTDTELLLGNNKIAYLKSDRRRGLSDVASLNALRAFELDVILDATGTASSAGLRELITAGIARKTLCTSNIDGIDLSIVYGVNQQEYNPELHQVISASTCTGNAFVPVAAVLEKQIGIEFGRIITIHPALSDQRVLDGYHTVSQLGRAWTASIIPTSTNVDKSTALIIPKLAGKLNSISYRIPTTIVSAIDATITLARDTSINECTEIFKEASETNLAGILQCDFGAWGHQRASIDYLGSPYSAILLMGQLTLTGKRQLGLSIMHDNEHAYCCRVLDTLGVLETGL